LLADSGKVPGSRLLDGQVTAVQQAIGTPKARAAAAGFLSEFAADLRKSGFVSKLVSEHGVRGVNVAR
jgi:polar amino acid transport system substrate-binding protein